MVYVLWELDGLRRRQFSAFLLNMQGHNIWQSMDQPGKFANPSRGQLKRGKCFSLSPFASEKLISRDSSDRPVPRQSG